MNENRLTTLQQIKQSLSSVKLLIGQVLSATIDALTELESKITPDTWKKNTVSSEGYVDKGEGQINKVWGTDAEGNPGWRDETAVSSSVAGIKGAMETDYHTGQVNLTPRNIGTVDSTSNGKRFSSLLDFVINVGSDDSPKMGKFQDNSEDGWAPNGSGWYNYCLQVQNSYESKNEMDLRGFMIQTGNNQPVYFVNIVSINGSEPELKILAKLSGNNTGDHGSMAYYIGSNDSGNINYDLVDFNVTSDMTLKELWNAIPTRSSWEIYFNSQDNTLNNDMPVTTGGILHIYKAVNDRGKLTFFDYRTGDIYTSSVINVNKDSKNFDWHLISCNILDEEATEANTTPDKYVSDAMVTRELLLRQNGVQWILDEDSGEITGYKTKAGADTVFPFSNFAERHIRVSLYSYGNNAILYDCNNSIKINIVSSVNTPGTVQVFDNDTGKQITTFDKEGYKTDSNTYKNLRLYNPSGTSAPTLDIVY